MKVMLFEFHAHFLALILAVHTSGHCLSFLDNRGSFGHIFMAPYGGAAALVHSMVYRPLLCLIGRKTLSMNSVIGTSVI